MNTKYTIKNFRVFDEQGVTVDIKPITILTGCNSSGKSSIVKSLILLNGYLNELKDDKRKGLPIELSKHCLDFTKKENSILGNFLRVTNRGSENTHITLEYSVHSQLLGEDLTISFEFAKENNDELRNGHPHSLRITDANGVTIYHSGRWMGGRNKSDLSAQINISAIKDRFFAFLYRQHLLYVAENYSSDASVGKISNEECNEAITNITDFFTGWKQTWGETFASDVSEWNKGRYYSLLAEEYGEHVSAVDIPYGKDVLYYMPIFDKTEALSKPETIEYLKSFKKESDKIFDIYTNMMIDKMLSLYAESEQESLFEYYKAQEKAVYDKFELYKKETPGIKIDSLSLYDPYMWSVTTASIEGDFNEVKEYIKDDQLKECQEKVDRFNIKTLITLLADLSDSIEKEQYQYKTEKTLLGFEERKFHTINLMTKYINMLLEEVVVVKSPDAIPYVSSSVVEQKRLYPLESSNEMSRLLKVYLERKRLFTSKKGSTANDKEKVFETGQFINKWSQIFGVADRFEIQIDPEGLGATIRRFRGEKDKGCLLAELGYGITQLLVVLIRIETAIMEALLDKNKVQACTIAIEEPEVHLHPKFQSLLADLFVEAHSLYNVDFIVETHSEYLIRKLQTLVGAKQISTDDLSLLYVNSKDNIEEGDELIRSIGFRKDGCLTSKFGPGFFDEADNLVNALLDIKVKANGNS